MTLFVVFNFWGETKLEHEIFPPDLRCISFSRSSLGVRDYPLLIILGLMPPSPPLRLMLLPEATAAEHSLACKQEPKEDERPGLGFAKELSLFCNVQNFLFVELQKRRKLPSIFSLLNFILSLPQDGEEGGIKR